VFSEEDDESYKDTDTGTGKDEEKESDDDDERESDDDDKSNSRGEEKVKDQKEKKAKKKKIFSNKDKAVLSSVVSLYLLYPTTTQQTFSLLSCKQVGDNYWLTEDLEEPCYNGRHLLFFFLLVIPQMLLYIFGLPGISLYFLHRNREKIKDNHPVVLFRYGLLFAGYRHDRYYWEVVMALRKVIIVAIGVFGKLTNTESQVHGALLALFLFILWHTTMIPFPTNTKSGQSVGILETFALTCCFCTMWCGLLFYHNTNTLTREVLSTSLVCLNVFFFACGIRIFWREFVKEQEIDIKMGGVRQNISKLAITLGRTASQMRLKKKEDISWLTNGSRSNESGGEQKVHYNPLLVGLKKNKDALAQSKKRSLMNKSSRTKHRARGSSVEADAERRKSGTAMSQTTKAKIQIERMKRAAAQQKKKKKRLRGGGGGSTGGGKMIEMSSLKGQGSDENRKAKKSSTTDAAATSANNSTIRFEDIVMTPMAPIIMPKEQSVASSEMYYDEVQEKYYMLDKVTGKSTWLPEKIESIGSERLDGHFTVMNMLRDSVNESTSEETVEVVIKNDDDDGGGGR